MKRGQYNIVDKIAVGRQFRHRRGLDHADRNSGHQVVKRHKRSLQQCRKSHKGRLTSLENLLQASQSDACSAVPLSSLSLQDPCHRIILDSWLHETAAGSTNQVEIRNAGGGIEKCSGHGAEDGVVSADRGSVLVVLCFGMANLIELRLEEN